MTPAEYVRGLVRGNSAALRMGRARAHESKRRDSPGSQPVGAGRRPFAARRIEKIEHCAALGQLDGELDGCPSDPVVPSPTMSSMKEALDVQISRHARTMDKRTMDVPDQ